MNPNELTGIGSVDLYFTILDTLNEELKKRPEYEGWAMRGVMMDVAASLTMAEAVLEQTMALEEEESEESENKFNGIFEEDDDEDDDENVTKELNYKNKESYWTYSVKYQEDKPDQIDKVIQLATQLNTTPDSLISQAVGEFVASRI